MRFYRASIRGAATGLLGRLTDFFGGQVVIVSAPDNATDFQVDGALQREFALKGRQCVVRVTLKMINAGHADVECDWGGSADDPILVAHKTDHYYGKG